MTSSDPFPEAKRELNDAISGAFSATEATGNHDDAYRHAVELYNVLGGGARRAVRLRSRMARRLQQAEGLSIRQLASRLRVAKSTVVQILNYADETPGAKPRGRSSSQ